MAPRPGATQPDRMSGISGKLGSYKKSMPKQTSQKKADMAKNDSIKIKPGPKKPMIKKPAERMSGAKMRKY